MYKNCDNKQGNNTSTEKFYKDIEKICKELDSKIEFVHFELTNSETLGYVYSLLAPSVLLKHQTTIDANTLNKNFYNELLYILGREEKKEDGKPIIAHTR